MRKVGLASLALGVVIACSNGSGTNDGGTDSSAGDGSDGGGGGFTQTGQIIQYGAGNAGVPDTIISGAGAMTTTDSKGNYTLTVPQNTAYTMQVVAGADAGMPYVSLDEQEWMLLGNAVRGKTQFVPAGTEGLLQAALNMPKPDPTLAVLSIEVVALGTCSPDAGGSDVTGATLSIPGLATDGGTGPVLVYFTAGGFPSYSATSVSAGVLPSAIIYNLPPTASFNQITVKHPTCTAKAFPVTEPSEPNIQYTGNVKLETFTPTGGAAQVVSFMRVFLD
jgi:hypothetical protein